MPRLVLFLVVAWLALPGTASAFTKTEKQLRMSDGVNIVYCRDQDKGMWFLPGSGMGPLQTTGRKMMNDIIRGQR